MNLTENTKLLDTECRLHRNALLRGNSYPYGEKMKVETEARAPFSVKYSWVDSNKVILETLIVPITMSIEDRIKALKEVDRRRTESWELRGER